MTTSYPKRLIEVDLPIKRISAHARREKSIRHGHISTLHIWWARRPLAACRAVICAALWPDPADPLCPETFREVARTQMLRWAAEHRRLLSPESFKRFNSLGKDPNRLSDPLELRAALLDFIADFANWDNSASMEYLETGRALTQAAHEALGGEPGTKPLVVDPFAGGGAIPLEVQRVGADAFASDLNPVAVLLNKVVLEYIPKYGQQLADEVRKWGQWIKEQAKRELAEFYPKDPDGAMPIAYLWARTIQCEGPGCGVEVPLIHSLWLAKREADSVALRWLPDAENKCVNFEIVHKIKSRDVQEGTLRNGSATCPVCGFTTPSNRIRTQLNEHQGGAADARLIAVVIVRPGDQRRDYRLPTQQDLQAVHMAAEELRKRISQSHESLNILPNEPIPTERPSPNARGLSGVTRIGIHTFADLFTPRQALALITLVRLVREAGEQMRKEKTASLSVAVQAVLGLSVSRFSDICNSLCRWETTKTQVRNAFTRQALSIVWDFAEPYIFADAAGDYSVTLNTMLEVLERNSGTRSGQAERESATELPLPDQIAQAFITDPPYYDAVPYADLSDFFYVWLKRALPSDLADLFRASLTPKDEEAIWNPSRVYPKTGKPKDQIFYETQMTRALTEGRRISIPRGIGVVVFAHKSTAGWEAILSALINAGWVVSASWPLDTEMGNRVNAMGTASLASSIHIICRPQEVHKVDEIGEWRDVLDQLPKRVQEWMPRLIAEGVVGADAIFACIGPAVEIFSRYSRVEKASGEKVTLREYLEYVWSAVAKEALGMILEGADSSQFEEDARLTAIWFWVLRAAQNGSLENHEMNPDDEEEESGDETDPISPNEKIANAKPTGYSMEYDAARKLAQGLGADLHKLSRPGGIITIKGNIAALHNVAQRENHLIGWQPSLFDGELPTSRSRNRKMPQDPKVIMYSPEVRQRTLFSEQPKAKTNPQQPALPFFDQAVEERALIDRLVGSGTTTLDRLHQAMLLFGRSQLALLGPFLTASGAGKDSHFWQLAQALSALYPVGSDEKRWVDGVLARKKGLGF